MKVYYYPIAGIICISRYVEFAQDNTACTRHDYQGFTSLCSLGEVELSLKKLKLHGKKHVALMVLKSEFYSLPRSNRGFTSVGCAGAKGLYGY